MWSTFGSTDPSSSTGAQKQNLARLQKWTKTLQLSPSGSCEGVEKTSLPSSLLHPPRGSSCPGLHLSHLPCWLQGVGPGGPPILVSTQLLPTSCTVSSLPSVLPSLSSCSWILVREGNGKDEISFPSVGRKREGP